MRSGTMKQANGSAASRESDALQQERQDLLHEAVENLRGSLAARGYAREGSWVPSIGNLKISQALQELVKPYLREETDLVEARVVALIAGVAWNLVSAPEIGRDEREELRKPLTPEAAACLDRLLRDMRKRKRSLFPDDRRIIAQTYVHPQSDGSFFFTAAAVT
jgi:hypothetical protein